MIMTISTATSATGSTTNTTSAAPDPTPPPPPAATTTTAAPTNSFTVTARGGFSVWKTGQGGQSANVGGNVALLFGGESKLNDKVSIGYRGGIVYSSTGSEIKGQTPLASQAKVSEDTLNEDGTAASDGQVEHEDPFDNDISDTDNDTDDKDTEGNPNNSKQDVTDTQTSTLGGIIEVDANITVNETAKGKDVISFGGYVEGGGAGGVARMNDYVVGNQTPTWYVGAGGTAGYRHEWRGKNTNFFLGGRVGAGWRMMGYDITGDKSGGDPANGFYGSIDAELGGRVHRGEAVSTGNVTVAGTLTQDDLNALVNRASTGGADLASAWIQDPTDASITGSALVGKSSFVIDFPTSDADEPAANKAANPKDQVKDRDGNVIDKIVMNYDPSKSKWIATVYKLDGTIVTNAKYPKQNKSDGTADTFPAEFSSIRSGNPSMVQAIRWLMGIETAGSGTGSGLTADDLTALNAAGISGIAGNTPGSTSIKGDLTSKGLKDSAGNAIGPFELKKVGDVWQLYKGPEGTAGIGLTSPWGAGANPATFKSIPEFVTWIITASKGGNVNVTMNGGKVETITLNQNVGFNIGYSTLTPDGSQTLANVAGVIRDLKAAGIITADHKVYCLGLASHSGGDATNFRLANERGDTAASQLTSNGIGGLTATGKDYASASGTTGTGPYYTPANSDPYVSIAISTKAIGDIPQPTYVMPKASGSSSSNSNPTKKKKKVIID